MAIETRDEFKALSSGCDVWIVSEPGRSKWARKIDWYLGFQIMKAGFHRSAALPAEIERIIREEELEGEFEVALATPSLSSGGPVPLMIASSSLLPASKTICVARREKFSEWVVDCHRIWTSLNRPAIRIFLPQGAEARMFTSSWPAADRDHQIEIVTES